MKFLAKTNGLHLERGSKLSLLLFLGFLLVVSCQNSSNNSSYDDYNSETSNTTPNDEEFENSSEVESEDTYVEEYETDEYNYSEPQVQKQWVNCEECNGRGLSPCGMCNGRGSYKCKGCHGKGYKYGTSGNSTYTCVDCGGTTIEDCDYCNGAGNRGNCNQCQGRGQVLAEF